MAMTPRKPEIEAMSAAIEDCESLDAVAKTGIKAAFELMQGRQLWIIATDARLVYGPYESETAAYNALAGGKVPDFEDTEGIKELRREGNIPTLAGKAAVLPMTGPLLLQKSQEEKDLEAHLVADHLCKDCEHPLVAHGVGRTGSNCSFIGCHCKAPKKP